MNRFYKAQKYRVLQPRQMTAPGISLCFFRPWTFGIHKISGNARVNENGKGATDIPHIAMLGLQHLQAGDTEATRLPAWSTTCAAKTKNRSTQKSAPLAKDAGTSMVKHISNFTASWASFLQTGVHYSEAARLIQTLLTTRMAARDNEAEDCNKADESDADAEIPALPYRPNDMRALLMQSRGRPRRTFAKTHSSSKKACITISTTTTRATTTTTSTTATPPNPPPRESRRHPP